MTDAVFKFNREAFKKLLTQRFFFCPSFELYGGIAGLYDLGPPGTAIKANILALWRQHFIITENMLEIDATSVTPEPVLVSSGHVARFTDLMVKDTVTGACFRADHLLEENLERLIAAEKDEKKLFELKDAKARADTFTDAEMNEKLTLYKVVAPDTNNPLSFPKPFNLMFKTSIGPTGDVPGYLRPETAQGIFVNFKRLLEFNGGKLPFASAQIGQAYRNEIAPRSGLLRVREFTLAEVEHFVNPDDKAHPKFESIANITINAFPRDDQLSKEKQSIRITVGDAVKQGMINNETLGYFIARTHLFLVACGIKEDKLMFRQHLSDEMAHYAADCWDAEILNSYGWTECVGIADRSAYDLTAHSGATKIPFTAFVDFKDGTRSVEVATPKLEKGKMGKLLGKKGPILIKYLEDLDADVAAKLESDLSQHESVTVTVGTDDFEVKREFISGWTKKKKNVTGAHITPGVIEPSFGIGRILYSVLEHAYYVRESDEQRGVLSLPAAISPVKVVILPLQSKQGPFVSKYTENLAINGISFRVDDSGAGIGKRYSRSDEIGIPFGVTVDFQSMEDGTVTLRERDSTNQVRLKAEELVPTLQQLINHRIHWKDVEAKFPKVEAQA